MFTRFSLLLLIVLLTGCGTNAEPSMDTTLKKTNSKYPQGVPTIIGYIADINETGMLVDDHRDGGTNKIDSALTSKTKYLIRDGLGFNQGKKSDLKHGMKVEVWYAGAMMESYPMKATASYVVYSVNDVNSGPIGKPHIAGYITSLEPSVFYVEEDPAKWGNHSKMYSLTSKETKYWTREGTRLMKGSRSALKKGMKVDVWYDGLLAYSYPGKGPAVHVIYHPQEIKQFKPLGKPNYAGVVTQIDSKNNRILLDRDPNHPQLEKTVQTEMADSIHYWIQEGDDLKQGSKSDLKKGSKVKIWYDYDEVATPTRLISRFIVIQR
ncbi:DUF3221 domain-containing protein [Paenactinomyces guangxiensis]|uniref:DUF3221 domain-containing protein n=1 Tax=Paenactinomyces guangxiensis TaxID=1490290 RepID=A0A7W1WR27_9BACL|nr:DUF3221 domain-containing protein [Paenactinomyces guangxiensis]MBA4494515.1 DUF3221 domain-containing protein [Paenactinomyces guangxiensis]MBH8591723.1 DUF3221 domain-containing protein [Paenactinomyces guangxiensis]